MNLFFRYTTISKAIILSVALCCMLQMGCDNASTNNKQQDTTKTAPVPVAPAVDDAGYVSVPELRDQLKIGDKGKFEKIRGKIYSANLFDLDVSDITPLNGLPLKFLDLTNNKQISDLSALKGMPLEELYLEGTAVSDLTPLQGLPLTVLWLGHSKVEDISPLAGMSLKQLNLFNTKVKDISVVAKMPLNTLWLKQTQVTNLSVIKEMSLQSLDINGTEISDLSPISEMRTLQRLNIAHSKVSDLTPLKNLRLNRLIFTPDNIKQGLDVIRAMKSLREIGTKFDGTPTDDRQPVAQFWAKHDANQK